jgi:hypothetical protein
LDISRSDEIKIIDDSINEILKFDIKKIHARTGGINDPYLMKKIEFMKVFFDTYLEKKKIL